MATFGGAGARWANLANVLTAGARHEPGNCGSTDGSPGKWGEGGGRWRGIVEISDKLRPSRGSRVSRESREYQMINGVTSTGEVRTQPEEQGCTPGIGKVRRRKAQGTSAGGR